MTDPIFNLNDILNRRKILLVSSGLPEENESLNFCKTSFKNLDFEYKEVLLSRYDLIAFLNDIKDAENIGCIVVFGAKLIAEFVHCSTLFPVFNIGNCQESFVTTGNAEQIVHTIMRFMSQLSEEYRKIVENWYNKQRTIF